MQNEIWISFILFLNISICLCFSLDLDESRFQAGHETFNLESKVQICLFQTLN